MLLRLPIGMRLALGGVGLSFAFRKTIFHSDSRTINNQRDTDKMLDASHLEKAHPVKFK